MMMIDLSVLEDNCMASGWELYYPADVSKGVVLELIKMIKEYQKDSERLDFLMKQCGGSLMFHGGFVSDDVLDRELLDQIMKEVRHG